MYCTSCKRKLGDDFKVCPYCGKGQPQKRRATDINNLPLGYSPKKNILLIVGIATVILVLFLLTLAPNRIYQMKLQRFHDTIRDAAVETEVVCNTVADVWHDVIFKEYQEHTAPYTQWNGKFYDDFTDALDLLDSSVYMSKERKNIAGYQKKVKKLYESLRNYTDKYADHYECAELLYESFNLLADTANDFHGLTYDEYSEILSALTDAFWTGSAALSIHMDTQ